MAYEEEPKKDLETESVKDVENVDENPEEVKQFEDTDVLANQTCPFCMKKTLSLTEMERDVPFFGKAFIYSMQCSSCNYFKSDVEFEKKADASKYTFEVTKEEDLTVRVVKSASATVKIPRILTITPGPVSNGYITNIEGILNRVEKILKDQMDAEEDNDAKKKIKNMLKKIQKAKWGQEPLTITIEDPNGNSAIISDKAVKGKI